MKNILLKKVKGQNEVIERLYQIAKRLKLGFSENNKPSSFLFVGPTGVGKTLLVKEFAKILVGIDNLISLDMSEYKEEHSISKIVGSPPGYVGYNNKTTVLEELKSKPHSVVLLDEIEKAHPAVINLFLQILDEGRIKDSAGNVIRLEHTIIIMTSNLGFNKQGIGFKEHQKELITTKIKDFLSPEIMNRLDDIILFNQLSKKEIREIIIEKLKELKDKYQKYQIEININNKVIEEIAIASNYEEYGARKIDKVLQSKLENLIIDGFLEGNKEFYIQTIQ